MTTHIKFRRSYMRLHPITRFRLWRIRRKETPEQRAARHEFEEWAERMFFFGEESK